MNALASSLLFFNELDIDKHPDLLVSFGRRQVLTLFDIELQTGIHASENRNKDTQNALIPSQGL